MKQKIIAALVLIALCVALVNAARYFVAPKTLLTKNARDIVRSRGQASATVWLVEFSDFQCPSCRRTSFFINQLLERHASQIYFQVRYYPIRAHKYGLKSAIYAECAAHHGRFWEFHDLLFARQDQWSKAPEDQIDALFEKYANELGIGLKPLRLCVQDPRTKQTVLEEAQNAYSMGIHSTPTFFVNGKMIAGEQLLREELKKYFAEVELIPR